MNHLRHFGRIWAVTLACVFGLQTAGAQETNRQSGVDYPAFKIIVERNIFNANRSGRRDTAPRETRPPVRVDSFALVGTMSYQRGEFAFFDGSSDDYRKSLQEGGTIAGYEVAEIVPSGVKLRAGEKEIEMKVGAQMRREDEGEWKLAEGTRDFSSSGRNGRSDSRNDGRSSRDSRISAKTDDSISSSAGSSDGASGADMSDVLKRLMERREQENR